MTRTERASGIREKSVRPKVWRPPSTLDAPPPPEGFVHRWIRFENQGFDDRKNMSARLREGFELVRAEEYPQRDDLPSIQDGKHAGVIAVGGLALARIPQELANQRNAYYRKMAGDQMTAVDSDLMQESNSKMPIEKPNRQSRVTFGGLKTS